MGWNKWFNSHTSTVSPYDGWNYLSILWLKLIHVNKMGPTYKMNYYSILNVIFVMYGEIITINICMLLSMWYTHRFCKMLRKRAHLRRLYSSWSIYYFLVSAWSNMLERLFVLYSNLPITLFHIDNRIMYGWNLIYCARLVRRTVRRCTHKYDKVCRCPGNYISPQFSTKVSYR